MGEPKCDSICNGRPCRNPVSWGAGVLGQRYYFCTRHKNAKKKTSFWRGTKWVKLDKCDICGEPAANVKTSCSMSFHRHSQSDRAADNE